MLLKPVLREAQKVVWQYMQAHSLQILPFHNYEHTRRVVAAVTEIAAREPVSPQELEIILLAAWFHDTGYSTHYKGHEAISRQLAFRFLKEQHYPVSGIQKVLGCIQATKVPQSPDNLLEMILCDADPAHLATADFSFLQDRLRREWSIYLDLEYSDRQWIEANLKFMNTHHYFTRYARLAWLAGKKRNILFLETHRRF